MFVGGIAWSWGAVAAEARDASRDARLAETYRQMLAEDPAQEYAFRRLLETAYAVGGLSGLIARYREEVEADPTRYAAWVILGNLHRTADDPTQALACYARAAALAPKKAAPHLLAAALHRHRRDYAEAFEAYERALPLISERDARQEALRAAAETAVEARDLTRARAYFEKIVQSEPGNLFLRMQEASTLSRLDEPALALEVWQSIEPRASGLGERVVIWKEKAALELELGRFEAALATWRKGLAELPLGHFERRAFLDGLVSVYRRTDGLERLIPELETLASRDNDALVVLAAVHEELAQDESALARYREAEQRSPRDEAIRMAVLSLLERLGRTGEVVRAREALVKAFPSEPRHALALAELLFQQGRAKDAQSLLRQTSRAHPNDPGVHVQLIDLWLRFGDKPARAEIEAEYKVLWRLEPDEPAHVLSLGEYYWSLGDRVRALETWRRLESMGRGPGEGSFLFGEVLFDHELLPEALVALEEARSKRPEDPRFIRALARLHEKAGRLAQATALWQQLVEGAQDGRRALAREARERLIELWEQGRRVDGELEALAKRFGAEPPDLGAGRLLALAQLRLGRITEARTVLERLERLDPDDVETLMGLEQVHTRLGATDAAIAVLERLAAVVPTSATEYLHRAADLALAAGREETASRLARRMLELAPGDAQAHLRVGELYLRMGLRADAAEAWREVLVLEPRNLSVRFKLASVYRDLGQEVRESQLLETIVRDTRDGSELLRAGRRLLQIAIAHDRLEALEEAIRPLVESRREGPQRVARLRFIVEVHARLARTILARDLAAERTDALLERLGERALKPLLEALDQSDMTLREEALAVLEATHPAGAVSALARLAADPEAVGRVGAIVGLGRAGTPGSVAVLAALEGSARELGLWALGLRGTDEGLAVLMERARSGSPRDRALIAAAVGHGRHAGGGPLALELARDRTPDARELGLWALGRLRFEGAIPELAARLVLGGREAQVAATSLAQIGTPKARAALIQAVFSAETLPAADAIWTALSAPREGSDVTAGYLAMLQRPRAALSTTRPTFHLGESSPSFKALTDSPLREAVAQRLAEALAPGSNTAVGVARWFGDLALFESPQPIQMAEFCASLLRPHVGSILDAMDAPEVRAAWLPVWSRWLRVAPPELSDEASRRLITHALQELDRSAAAVVLIASLEVLGAPTLRPLVDTWAPDARLAPLYRHPDHSVQVALAEVAALTGDTRGIQALLDDPEPRVAKATAVALGRVPLALPEASLKRLAELAASPEPALALSAIDALAGLRETQRLTALRVGAPAEVRARIARWLAASGAPVQGR
jgi:tetratricopeptide (TPR) repeat protein